MCRSQKVLWKISGDGNLSFGSLFRRPDVCIGVLSVSMLFHSEWQAVAIDRARLFPQTSWYEVINDSIFFCTGENNRVPYSCTKPSTQRSSQKTWPEVFGSDVGGKHMWQEGHTDLLKDVTQSQSVTHILQCAHTHSHLQSSIPFSPWIYFLVRVGFILWPQPLKKGQAAEQNGNNAPEMVPSVEHDWSIEFHSTEKCGIK